MRNKKSLKRWVRRRYLIWKYKHNCGTGKLIVTKASDRQMGLSTLMLRDCLQNNYKLFVPNEMTKDNMVMMLQRMIYSPYMTTTINPIDYIVTPHDINTKKLRDCSDIKLLVDNSCTPYDVGLIIRSGCEIINGFVYYAIAA